MLLSLHAACRDCGTAVLLLITGVIDSKTYLKSKTAHCADLIFVNCNLETEVLSVWMLFQTPEAVQNTLCLFT